MQFAEFNILQNNNPISIRPDQVAAFFWFREIVDNVFQNCIKIDLISGHTFLVRQDYEEVKKRLGMPIIPRGETIARI